MFIAGDQSLTSFSFQTAVFLGSCFLQHPVFACQCRRATSGALLPRPCLPIWRRCPCNSYEGHLLNACACITLPPADNCAQHRNTNQGLFEVLAWFLVCSPRVLHRATRVSQCRCDPCSSYQVNVPTQRMALAAAGTHVRQNVTGQGMGLKLRWFLCTWCHSSCSCLAGHGIHIHIVRLTAACERSTVLSKRR